MKGVFLSYLGISIALIFNLLLEIFKSISLRGYWPDRFLFWWWLVYTIYLLIKYWKIKGVKIFGYTLTALLVLTILPLFVPLIGILITGFGFDRTYGNDFNVNLRMQVTSKSLLARPNVELIKKRVPWNRSWWNERVWAFWWKSPTKRSLCYKHHRRKRRQTVGWVLLP